MVVVRSLERSWVWAALALALVLLAAGLLHCPGLRRRPGHHRDTAPEWYYDAHWQGRCGGRRRRRAGAAAAAPPATETEPPPPPTELIPTNAELLAGWHEDEAAAATA